MKSNNLTRRQFIATTAATISSASVISRITRAQSSSPNEKLLCAVIGCHGRGGSHISAFTGRKDCEIAYIVDIDEKVGHQPDGKRQRKAEISNDQDDGRVEQPKARGEEV